MGMNSSIREIFQYSKEYDMANGIPLRHNKYNRYFKDNDKYDLEFFGLTFTQRVGCFFTCFFIGFLFFIYSMLNILGSITNPSKFALPYAFSNFLFFIMIGFLIGFKKYFKSIFSENRWKYTCSFLFSTFFTIYCALKIQSYLFNLLMALVQISCFIIFAITFLPKGAD